MKGLQSLFRDVRGGGYIKTLTLCLVVCMIFSAVFYFASALSVVSDLKKELKLLLDGSVTSEALAEYSSLADGSDFYLGRAAEAFADAFDDRFADCLTGGEPYAVLRGSEGVIWEMTRPEIDAVEGARLRLRLSATVRLPVRFGGVRLGTITVPLTVISKYYSKFA